MWTEYARKRGTLNVGMRLERGFAMLALMISSATGNKGDFNDFAPHFDEPEIPLAQAMKEWN